MPTGTVHANRHSRVKYKNSLHHPASKRTAARNSAAPRSTPMRIKSALPIATQLILALTCISATPQTQPAPATQPIKEIKIDMDKAIEIALPPSTDLKPAPFKTTDG